MRIQCCKQIKQVAKLKTTNRMQNMQIRGSEFHFFLLKKPYFFIFLNVKNIPVAITQVPNIERYQHW